jgi:hypothetical protein
MSDTGYWRGLSISFCTGCISGTTFFVYLKAKQFGKPNDL